MAETCERCHRPTFAFDSFEAFARDDYDSFEAWKIARDAKQLAGTCAGSAADCAEATIAWQQAEIDRLTAALGQAVKLRWVHVANFAILLRTPDERAIAAVRRRSGELEWCVGYSDDWECAGDLATAKLAAEQACGVEAQP